jgi:Uncharacterized protein conserved in bacteria
LVDCALACVPAPRLPRGQTVTDDERGAAIHDTATAIQAGLPYLTETDRRELAEALLAGLPRASRAMEAVREWHEAAETMHGVMLTGPHNYPLRSTLLLEEAGEAARAFMDGDRAHMAKELCDVLVVTYGSAIAAELDLDAAFEEVHRSNMSKLPGCTVRADGKLCKGPDYVAPDMSAYVNPSVR